MPERHPLPLLTSAVPRLHLTQANTCLLLQDLHAPFADAATGWLAKRARYKVLLREFDEYFEALDLVGPNITKIVSRCRDLGLPLIYSCLGYLPPTDPSPFQQATGWTWDLSGAAGAFPSAWRPEQNDRIFAKPGWGALASSDLQNYIQAQGIVNVILMGTLLEFGIRQTCVEFIDQGHQVLVVSDGVVALTQAGRTFTAGSIAHGMIKLRSTGEVMDVFARLEAHKEADV